MLCQHLCTSLGGKGWSFAFHLWDFVFLFCYGNRIEKLDNLKCPPKPRNPSAMAIWCYLLFFPTFEKRGLGCLNSKPILFFSIAIATSCFTITASAPCSLKVASFGCFWCFGWQLPKDVTWGIERSNKYSKCHFLATFQAKSPSILF